MFTTFVFFIGGGTEGAPRAAAAAFLRRKGVVWKINCHSKVAETAFSNVSLIIKIASNWGVKLTRRTDRI